MNRLFYVDMVPPEMESKKKGQVGLANLGNTCYLNSALQCLRHVPDLTVFFGKHSDSWIHQDEEKNSALCRAYKDLIAALWAGEGPSYLRPGVFLKSFRHSLKDTMFEHMIAPMPHDAHEAIMFLLDQLHEGMKRPLNINVVAEEGSPVYGALMAWKEKVAPEYSPIVDYFFGLMEISVTCQGCNHVSCRYEAFNMLTGDFPDMKHDATLEECIDKAFVSETIDEYECEKCSPAPRCSDHKDSTETVKGCEPCSSVEKPKRHPGIIQRRIWRLPQNLIVVAKRFSFQGGRMKKCQANLKAETVQKFEKWFAPASPESSHRADYALQSVVDHHGSGNGGHYTAQVKSPLTGLWDIYDDETVQQLRDGSRPQLGSMSYILFYRKV